jgi:galacturan 1,4-alpha-galacturonidase
MGSIGQYSGVEDIIENVWIENVTLLNGEVRDSHPLMSD